MAAFDDRISIVYTPPGAIQAPLARDMASRVDAVWIDTARAGCGPGSACGLRRGMRVLLFDIGGVGDGYDVFTLTGTRREVLLHGSPNSPLARVYRRADTWVTEVTQRVYYHDVQTSRLMRYDGYRSDQPLVDHVVGFDVAYYVDPSPTSVPPPPPGFASCVYDAGDPPRPLLRDLGGETPTRLTLAQLRDGPICGVAPNRFDGDLLRVRRIGLTVRVRVASDRLRRADPDGVSSGVAAARVTPTVEDYSVSVDVAPRVSAGWFRPSASGPAEPQ